jgi:signal transduction histidine kinase
VSARIEVRAALAHDLKSPLAVITGFAELLARREDPALRTEASARIAEAAERLGEAIDDALALLARERHPRSRRRQRVVLVGHDPFVRDLLAQYDIDETDDAAALGEAALVILDRADEDVLRAVKAGESDTAVVVLSSDTDPRARAEALELGADAFLSMPFSPLRLLAVVEELLSR